MSFPRGSGASVRVSVLASLEGLPFLDFSLLSKCKAYRLGIGHTRLPMTEHLGQPQMITVLRGAQGTVAI